MRLFIELCMACVLASYVKSSNFTDVVDLKTSKDGNIVTFNIHKKRPGFLGMGFGKNMTQADVFIIEISQDQVHLQSCQLAGHNVPINCTTTGPWILEKSDFADDRTWSAKVTRDISKVMNVKIEPDVNDVIFDLSDWEKLEMGHRDPTNVKGVQPFSFHRGKFVEDIQFISDSV